MKRSIRRKYQMAGCGMILGFLLFSMLLNNVFKLRFVVWKNKEKMEALAQEIVSHLNDGEENLQEYLDAVSSGHNVRITITDETYRFLIATGFRENRKHEVFHLIQEALEDCRDTLDRRGSFFTSEYYDETNNCPYLIQMNKIEGYGYVTVRKSLVGLSEDMDYMNTFYLIAGGITLAISFVLIAGWSRKTVEPLEKMNRVTRQIADLNFSEALPVNSEDEIGMLADSINVMSAQLEKNLEELQKGIQFRKNLIRNMAHELKTPVAVVMGYAENLPAAAAHSQERLKKYSAVISGECSRMNQIIQEMLEHSAYENREESLQRQQFSADLLLKEIRARYEADFGGLGFSYRDSNEIATEICADCEMLQQAIYNFIKNAVQHCRKRGEIFVHFYDQDSRHCFSVYNSGSTIPEEELDRIWEVFYKVDKARSRERASCGIGLSIVKEIAVAHGGGVLAENVRDGVQFTIYIEK